MRSTVWHRLASWRRVWQAFWATPDPVLVDAGAAGEQVVARTRLVLAALVWAVPVLDLLTPPPEPEIWIGVAAASVGVLLAVGALALSRRRLYRPWVGFATSLVDVSLVSLALAAFLATDQPHIAVNSRVVYPIYFLAIAATGLRFDPRISVVTGAAAMAQYGAIVAVAATRWDLNAAAYAPFKYGMFGFGDQVSRLILLAVAAAITMAIVRRTRRLQWLSARDRLTGVLNRAVLDDLLEYEAERAWRSGKTLAVVMLDLDGFKRFNDTYGHPAGDLALGALAGVIRRLVRYREAVARYGGDEFVILFPDTTAVQAVERAEALRTAVAATPVSVGRHDAPVHLTVSVGVAELPLDGPSGPEVLEQADLRLYEAKQAGRNQVVGPGLVDAARAEQSDRVER